MVDDRPERVFHRLVALLDDPLTALYRRVERDSFALKIALIAAAADLVSASTARSARSTTISRGAIQGRLEKSAGPQGHGGRPP